MNQLNDELKDNSNKISKLSQVLFFEPGADSLYVTNYLVLAFYYSVISHTHL